MCRDVTTVDKIATLSIFQATTVPSPSVRRPRRFLQLSAQSLEAHPSVNVIVGLTCKDAQMLSSASFAALRFMIEKSSPSDASGAS
jgi:hypothetical protein